MSTEQKTPTAEELLAVATPAQPQELEYKFPDGTVIKGKDQQELLDKAAKRYVDSRSEAQKLKDDNAALRQAVTTPPTTPAPGQPGFDSTKYWQMMEKNPAEANAYAVASYFGFDTPEEMRETLTQTVGSAQDYANRALASRFLSVATDFPGGKEAEDALTQKVADMGGSWTVESLLGAHMLCIKEGKYKPAEIPVEASPQTPAAPPPPPMLSQPAAAVAGTAPNLEEMANKMSPADLRAAIEKLAAGGGQ